MTHAESLSFIVAAAAFVATALAALAAFRSARTANLAQQALVDEQLRTGRRDVAALVSACSYELQRIRSFALHLNTIDRANAMFTGGVGGSRHKLAEEGVSKRVSTAEEVFQAASPFRDNPTAIGELTQGDVDRLQVELTIRLGDLRVIADELGRDSASREAQMMQHRERAIIGEAK